MYSLKKVSLEKSEKDGKYVVFEGTISVGPGGFQF